MKKLICVAVVVCSMLAMADEAAKPAVAAPAAPESVKVAPKRPQISEEQREKFMAERKAKMEQQILEVVKEYVPEEEEEKAKALVKELQDAMMAGRRNAVRRPPKPGAEKPAEAK